MHSHIHGILFDSVSSCGVKLDLYLVGIWDICGMTDISALFSVVKWIHLLFERVNHADGAWSPSERMGMSQRCLLVCLPLHTIYGPAFVELQTRKDWDLCCLFVCVCFPLTIWKIFISYVHNIIPFICTSRRHVQSHFCTGELYHRRTRVNKPSKADILMMLLKINKITRKRLIIIRFRF
jgi:hypothetical protein